MANETVGGLQLVVTLRGYVAGLDGAMLRVEREYVCNFTDGTGNNQIGYVWQDTARALNATNETLDLDALTDFQGAAQTGCAVAGGLKLIWIEHKSTTAAEILSLGGGDLAGATGPLVDTSDLVRVGPKGFILWVSPYEGATITASTGDGLKVAVTGNTTYDITLAGRNT